MAGLCIPTMVHAQLDATPHKVSFLEVQENVKLEVLDWGGTGRPLVLLPGLGDTAHVFDSFALKLSSRYHVFGITPRGFGNSSAPAPTSAKYSADQLGDDVLAVIDTLRLDRPVLAGHSVAGEVLSSVGTRYPERLSALVYIDGGYPYALYDKAHGDMVLDALALRDELNELHLGTLPRNPKEVDDLLLAVQRLQKELEQRKDDLSLISPPPAIGDPKSVAILDGERKYTQIFLPVLAIFNVPHSPPFRRTMENQVAAFENQVPQTRIVRIADADHYLFQSKEAEVVHEIDIFIDGLQNQK
jgi:non-heme chloroperoxidase